MSLPPYARRLDVRATRAAFAAGTLSTIRDDPLSVHEERGIESSHPDRHNADLMHEEIVRLERLRLWQRERP